MASDNFPYPVLKVVDLKLKFVYDAVDDGVVYIVLCLRMGAVHYRALCSVYRYIFFMVSLASPRVL